QHVELGLAEQIDEAGRHDEVRRVDAGAGRRAIQPANGRDAIANDADVAAEPRTAGAVDDAAVGDQDVEMAAGRGLRTTGRERRERRCHGDERGRAKDCAHGGKCYPNPAPSCVVTFVTCILSPMSHQDGSRPTWLLLVHQLPPRPSNLRVKTWRRLQDLGAVALKNSVY